MRNMVVHDLWPATPPGGAGVKLENRVRDFSELSKHVPELASDRIGRPHFTAFAATKPNRTGLLLIPGGGYGSIWYSKEGDEIAARFNEAGIACFVLQYRLPGEGWARRADVPLQDGMRAMRLIRKDAARFGIDPQRLGVMGFSAGGHLAASLATRFDQSVYEAVDEADALVAKPAFAGLIYPVIAMGKGTHEGSRDNLLGADASPDTIAAYSCEKTVRPDMMPCFLAHAVDDDAVPFAENSLAMYRALLAEKVPAELHAFESGGHGFALREMAGKPFAAWPDLFLAWLRSHGFMT